MIIGISGSSGVGKTVFANLLKKYMCKNDPILIHGDNYHKWERGHSMWSSYTHLNPDANNLELAEEHLKLLKSNISINIREYNHDTGKFDPEKTVYPSQTIIFEGLHALYGNLKNILDVKIYVDTDDDLKKQWKIKRDTHKRGYTLEQVLSSIEKRKPDEEKYINPQKHDADIVVKFSLDGDKIVFSYFCMNSKYEDFMKEFYQFYHKIQDFITLCKTISYDYSLAQNKGGNISYKINNQEMLITCSGNSLNDVNIDTNYTLFNYYKFLDENNRFLDSYFDVVKRNSYQSVASMESGMHSVIHKDVVVHLHPILVNTILCSKNSKSVIDSLFGDYDYEFIPYVAPGVELMNAVKNSKKDILFLENHGIVVSGNNVSYVIETIQEINRRCKNWIVDRSMTFLPYYNSVKDIPKLPLFPDAAIIDSSSDINTVIHKNILDCDMLPNFLTDSNISELKNMEFEKYRREK